MNFRLNNVAPRSNIAEYHYSPPNSPDNVTEDHIFENNSFLVEIRQIAHTRASQFNIDDHLYQMSILPKTDRDIRLSDLFELLNQIIIK